MKISNFVFFTISKFGYIKSEEQETMGDRTNLAVGRIGKNSPFWKTRKSQQHLVKRTSFSGLIGKVYMSFPRSMEELKQLVVPKKLTAIPLSDAE